MKKIFSIAIVLLIVLGAKAQREEGSVTVQPRAGVNMSKLDDYNKMKFGYNFGIEMEYQMTEQLSLSAALMYSDQGGKDDTDGTKTTLDIDYVNVPIMLNYYVAPEVLPGLAVKAGVQPAFRTKTTVKADGIKMDVDWLLKEMGYDSSEMNKFMFSVPVGLSYEFRNFVLDARYNIGISDMFKGEGKMRNNVIQVTLGYKFDAEF